MLSPLAIRFGFKVIRTPKNHASPRLKHHVFTSCWIPSPPFMLFFYTELPKATNQTILTGFQVSFDKLKESFNRFS